MSYLNDNLRTRTVSGTVHLYDNQRCIGTAEDKALAARLGSASYDQLAPDRKDHHSYFTALRHNCHFVNEQLEAQKPWFDRKRKFDNRYIPLPLRRSLSGPIDHPKVAEREQRRVETNLMQAENQTFADYQDRRKLLRPETPQARRKLDEPRQKLTPRVVSQPAFERMKQAHEAPRKKAVVISARSTRSGRSGRSASVGGTDDTDRISCGHSVRSAQSSVHEARRKAAQLLNETANFAHCRTANTYSNAVPYTKQGNYLHDKRRSISLARLENSDFAVTRQNNHWSRNDKLTRMNEYYMKPKLAVTNNSVKYDILTQQVPPFAY